MSQWLANKMARCCGSVSFLRPKNDAYDSDLDRKDVAGSGRPARPKDVNLWYRDLERHAHGEFSYAVVRGNDVIEDESQVVTGSGATFVGIYDGHGGVEASRFVANNLVDNFIRVIEEHRAISIDVLRSAVAATEAGFFDIVQRTFLTNQQIAAVGSCCLVGVIWSGTLYIANLGDSKAVIGMLDQSKKNITPHQLTSEHNASRPEIRAELMTMHPDVSDLIVDTRGVWRIKGIIQVSRTIGDVYLKKPEYALDDSHPRFHLRIPIESAILSAEPSVLTREIQPNDKFIIFASDGLWEHISNEKAVQIVHDNPRVGIARRLIKFALKEAAKKFHMKYDDFKRTAVGRRVIHDDITVVVIFLDHKSLQTANLEPDFSIRSFTNGIGSSRFNILQTIQTRPSAG